MSLFFDLRKDIAEPKDVRLGYGAFYWLREELKKKSKFNFEYLEHAELEEMTPEEYAFYDFMTQEDAEGDISNKNCKILYKELIDINVDDENVYKSYKILMKSLKAAIDDNADLHWE